MRGFSLQEEDRADGLLIDAVGVVSGVLRTVLDRFAVCLLPAPTKAVAGYTL
jgi:hypothetical protein